MAAHFRHNFRNLEILAFLTEFYRTWLSLPISKFAIVGMLRCGIEQLKRHHLNHISPAYKNCCVAGEARQTTKHKRQWSKDENIPVLVDICSYEFYTWKVRYDYRNWYREWALGYNLSRPTWLHSMYQFIFYRENKNISADMQKLSSCPLLEQCLPIFSYCQATRLCQIVSQADCVSTMYAKPFIGIFTYIHFDLW